MAWRQVPIFSFGVGLGVFSWSGRQHRPVLLGSEELSKRRPLRAGALLCVVSDTCVGKVSVWLKSLFFTGIIGPLRILFSPSSISHAFIKICKP